MLRAAICVKVLLSATSGVAAVRARELVELQGVSQELQRIYTGGYLTCSDGPSGGRGLSHCGFYEATNCGVKCGMARFQKVSEQSGVGSLPGIQLFSVLERQG